MILVNGKKARDPFKMIPATCGSTLDDVDFKPNRSLSIINDIFTYAYLTKVPDGCCCCCCCLDLALALAICLALFRWFCHVASLLNFFLHAAQYKLEAGLFLVGVDGLDSTMAGDRSAFSKETLRCSHRSAGLKTDKGDLE